MATSIGFRTYKEEKTFTAIKVSDVLWLIVFNFLFFQMALQGQVEFLSYIDESFTILILFLAILYSLGTHEALLTRYEHIAEILLTVCALLALLGNIFNQIQIEVWPIAIDLLTCVKFVIALLGSIIVFRNKNTLLYLLQGEAKLLILIMTFCAILNLFIDIGMSRGTRYGIKSFTFIFSHPSYVGFLVTACIVLLCGDIKKNKYWIFTSLIILVLTLRAKCIGFAAFTLITVLFMTSRRKLSPGYIILAILIVVYIGWDQITTYYQDTGTARSELTSASFSIANQYFPIGSGFATFGSSITTDSDYYSSLYYEYGLNTIYGLQLGETSFLSDTFWPIVLAQFGWIGMICYILVMYFLTRSTYKRSKDIKGNESLFILPILVFAFLLISSTSETAFFHPSAICIAACFGLVLACKGSDFKDNIVEINNNSQRLPVRKENLSQPYLKDQNIGEIIPNK